MTLVHFDYMLIIYAQLIKLVGLKEESLWLAGGCAHSSLLKGHTRFYSNIQNLLFNYSKFYYGITMCKIGRRLMIVASMKNWCVLLTMYFPAVLLLWVLPHTCFEIARYLAGISLRTGIRFRHGFVHSGTTRASKLY